MTPGTPHTAALDTLLTALRADPQVRALLGAGCRPRIGVSACLLGERVRYDGDHRRMALLADLLPQVATPVPLCPEVAIGLGVPRPTIQRVRLPDGREIVRGVVDTDLDVTARLDAYAAAVVAAHTTPAQALHGYIFKARSPSCAPGNAPLLDAADAPLGTAWGRYAEGLHRAWPDLPVCHEEEVTTAVALAGFVGACYRRMDA